MRLSSFFKRRTDAPAAEAGDEVRELRARSRQRLIGAAVLIAVGVIGFPIVFETEPRPIAIDIPIEIARKDQVPPLVIPPPRVQAVEPPAAASSPTLKPPASSIAKAPPESPKPPASTAEPASPTAKAPADVAAPKPPQSNAAAKAREPAAKPAPAPKSTRADDARARALLEGNDAPKKDEKVAAASARFIVQVGAFSEEIAAREMRQRVERLGLKTHTQSVATSGGRIHRVRVGPYASRDEADRIAARLESAGLTSAVLTL